MKVILVRHGEPTYQDIEDKKMPGLGYELGKLTKLGVSQAEERALDPILNDADLIISSVYTRALQTAAIISRITRIKLEVETDLHEWFSDTRFKFDYDTFASYDEYIKYRGLQNDITKYRYETYESIQKRTRKALEKYKHLNKIIVVCHGIVMSSFTHFDDLIEHCGVREIEL